MTAVTPQTLRRAAQLMQAKAPTGKTISVCLNGINDKLNGRNVLLRLDFPGVMRAFCAYTGELLFTATAAELEEVLED